MALKIEEYAVIGDCETAALVGKNGSIDWLCWPDFASGACFAALLGTTENGYWQIAPGAEVTGSSRAYRSHTLVLETKFETSEGAVRLIDFMPVRGKNSDVVRIVEGVRGSVAMRMELALRFDYGRTVPWVTQWDGGVRAIAGPDLVVLRSSIETHGEEMKTVADFTVSVGERVWFALTYGVSYEEGPGPIDAEQALEETQRFWEEWTGKGRLCDRYSEAIERSLITLKALTYRPTGGIVAAVTTSLPEAIGGPRNWDYRYCWLRDTTFTLLALMNGGYYEEAGDWQDWLLRALAGSPDQVQIMYGIKGERRLYEWEVPWLEGYEGSKPVRVGNAAAEQLQLDIYGEVMDAFLHAQNGLKREQDLNLHVERALLEHLELVWESPDEGIWETRGGPQQFTYSKMMAWVAFDRAIRAMEHEEVEAPLERWRGIRQKIHDQICERAFDAELGSFVQMYGSKALDASLLLMPLVGFLPGSDARVRGTIEAIEKTLMRDGLVLRYDTHRVDDGLPAGEGVFLACSFWMVSALKAIGREDDARALFVRLLELRNDVGLLSEEYDVADKRLVGNFPQAFSHIALVNAAFDLQECEAVHERERPEKSRTEAAPVRSCAAALPAMAGNCASNQCETRSIWWGKTMHRFRVWAPKASTVDLKIGEVLHSMQRVRGGWWQAEIAEAGPGTDYLYVVNGEDLAVPDPRSMWQPHGVHGPSRVVDHGAFTWTDVGWQAPPLQSAIFYELHIGTFTPEGTLDSAQAKLGYLKELGVTHVELLPVAAFPGERGWGYDGVALFAVQESYGGPEGLKRFVDACHAHGLAVVMDVVYNHLGPSGNYLGKFGPYFTDLHHTPWGDAVNLEEAGSHEVRRFFVDNALHWLRDYHCDGLRLDAVHAYMDRSAIHFMEQLSEEVRALEGALGKHFALIAESDLNDPRIVTPREAGGYGMDAQWSDDFHHALVALLEGNSHAYYADFGKLEHVAKALRSAFVYDGVYSEFRDRVHGRPVIGLPGWRFLGFAQNHDQVGNRVQGERLVHQAGWRRAKVAAALVMTAPFIPMLFQGEEFGASAPFLYFTDHEDPELGRLVAEGRKKEFSEYAADHKVVPNPQDEQTFLRSKLHWSEETREPHAEMLAWHRELIRLRKSQPSLTDGNLESIRVRFDEEARWMVVERGALEVVVNLAGGEQRFDVLDGTAMLLTSEREAVLEGTELRLPGDSVAVVRVERRARNDGVEKHGVRESEVVLES